MDEVTVGLLQGISERRQPNWKAPIDRPAGRLQITDGDAVNVSADKVDELVEVRHH